MEKRDEVLTLLRERCPQFDFCWTTTRGDVPDRLSLVEVRGADPHEQRNFLRDIRDLRPRLAELLGSRCMFVFLGKP